MNEMTKQDRTPQMIAAEINTIKRQAAQTLAQAAYAIGQRLCEAKELVPAGEWLTYLQEQLEYRPTTAENLMRIYREFGDEQVDLLTGKSPAELFAGLNQSQMVAMFSLEPPERVELMEEHPELPELSARQVQALVEEKKAAEAERDRERKQRENAEKLAVSEADRANKEARKALEAENRLKTDRQTLSDLEQELEREREARNRLEEQQSLAEQEIEQLKNRPVETTYTEPPEELKQQIRDELQADIDAANRRAADAEARAANLQNQDAQTVAFAFREIQAKFGVIRDTLPRFREINPDKADKLAAAIGQTLENMAHIVRGL